MIGVVIGAAGDYYWMHQMRKAESALALHQANAAEKKGDIDSAIIFAAQSYALHPESPLAGLMLKELKIGRAHV